MTVKGIEYIVVKKAGKLGLTWLGREDLAEHYPHITQSGNNGLGIEAGSTNSSTFAPTALSLQAKSHVLKLYTILTVPPS